MHWDGNGTVRSLSGIATSWGLKVFVPHSLQHSLIQQLSTEHPLSMRGTRFGGSVWEENRQNSCPYGAYSLLNVGGETHESSEHKNKCRIATAPLILQRHVVEF